MNNKKLIAVLLAMAVVSVSGGCGNKEKDAADATPDTGISEETTKFDIDARVSEAKEYLSELSETEASDEELPEGSYEVNNFRFDFGDKFEFYEEKNKLLKFKSKDTGVYIGISSEKYEKNARTIAYAEGIAKMIEDGGGKAECGDYENPYMECSYIKASNLSKFIMTGDSEDLVNLDLYFARTERDVISFMLSYDDESADAVPESVDYILGSLVHTGKDVISGEGGTFENDFMTFDFDEKWYVSDSYSSKDDFAVSSDTYESVTLNYSLVDTEALIMTGITISGLKSKKDTVESYTDEVYERALSSSVMSNVTKSEGKILGHKANVISFDMIGSGVADVSVDEYFFKDHGNIIIIVKEYPIENKKECSEDMDNILESIKLK